MQKQELKTYTTEDGVVIRYTEIFMDKKKRPTRCVFGPDGRYAIAHEDIGRDPQTGKGTKGISIVLGPATVKKKTIFLARTVEDTPVSMLANFIQ